MTKSLGLISRRRAYVELLFAASLWGFGFVATEWGLLSFSPMKILLFRFIIGVFAGEILQFIIQRRWTPIHQGDMRYAIGAGALLSLFLIPQTIGMQYTTATNSGFLTTLYIIFVPILNHLLFRVKTGAKVYSAVGLALFGAFLLMGGQLNSMNRGDLVTLICAVMGAFHIIYLGKISPRVYDVVRFNNWQTFFCLIAVLPFFLVQEAADTGPATALVWAGVIFLGIGSSAVAFIFQVRAQKVLSDTTASMLFLLESPFAFVFGFLLLGDRLNTMQLIGAGIILLSSALTILWDSPEYSSTKTLK